jgi:hypothetical protein
VKIDPEVRRALERARATGKDETVVVHLRGEEKAKSPSPAETQQLAERLIDRASQLSGSEPKQKTIFENLGSMAIKGHPDLLTKILEQPEVHAASMNRPEGGEIELIRPVRKSQVKGEDWVETSE